MRVNRRTKFFDKLKKVEVLRESTDAPHGDSTLSAAVAAGVDVIGVASATNFTAGDIIFVGSGETLEVHTIDSIAVNDITLVEPLHRDQDAGDSVVEVVKTSLGHIHEGGVTVTTPGEFTQVKSAIRHLTVSYLRGYFEIMAAFGLLGWSPENFAFAFGIPETAVTGAGTVADPSSIFIGDENVGTEGDMAIRFTGALKDLTVVEFELWGAEVDFTQLQTLMQRGQVSQIPFSVKATSGALIRQSL